VGFVWLMLQTILTKVVNSLATLLVAWYLLPADYRVAFLAFPINLFLSVFQQVGIDKVLISRGTEFSKWANAGFWMSTTAGFASGLLILATAPLAARFYHSPSLFGLLAWLAVLAPATGITTVHQAWLQYQLKFKLLGMLGIVSAVFQALLTVFMAYRGYGAYAIVVPLVAAGLLRFVVLVTQVRIPIQFHPDVDKWRHLIKDGSFATLIQFMFLVVTQGDFLLLGAVFAEDSDVPGIFSFVFNLSISLLTPLVMNLSAVIFPALSTMAHDRAQQVRIFLRASKTLAAFAVPLFLLQAAVAQPVLRAIYHEKWEAAIVPLQILSICMAVRVVCVTNFALYSAQGRFRYHGILTTVYAVLFLATVYAGATRGTVVSVAVAETIFFIIFDNINLYLAVKPGGGTFADVLKLYVAPFVGSAVALAVALGVGYALPAPLNGNVARVLMISMISFVLYVPLLRLMDRDSFAQIAGQFNKFSRKLGFDLEGRFSWR
jgi:O-antigen/teichoic acid export membrane protein